MVERCMEAPAEELSGNFANQNLSSVTQFLVDVVSGLGRPGQKGLPPLYLYDDLGSALFEAITYLPEYGLIRADERLLERYAGRLPAYFPKTPLIVELRSGSGRKTRHVLNAWHPRRRDDRGDELPLTYIPIDVSTSALAQCQKELSGVTRVVPVASGYLKGVQPRFCTLHGRSSVRWWDVQERTSAAGVDSERAKKDDRG